MIKNMNDVSVSREIFARYKRLQQYVGWTSDDARRVAELRELLEPIFPELVDDFYAAVAREPDASKVITGGGEQIARLRVTLLGWLGELFAGPYDEAYVIRRWKVGMRHVAIGLDQAFANAAMSRLRDGLFRKLEKSWSKSYAQLCQYARSLNRLIDLDLAIIQDAYELEFAKRQQELTRLRTEAAFGRLVAAAGVVIAILRNDHSIAYINPYTEQISGYSARSVEGQNFFNTFLPDRRQWAKDDVRRWLEVNAQPGYESPMLCRDHRRRWILWSAQALEEFGGDPAILVIGQDITARKSAEMRALQSERLAAIGETVAGLAHESRNAFQRSQACLELLALELDNRPDELELVSRIQRSLDHLHRLYEEVRRYAGPINLDRQVCDLGHVWRDSWSFLEPNWTEKKISFTEQLKTLNLQCHADWFALGQAFRNVFENAIVATPEGGDVEVECREVVFQGAPALEVSIRDTGPGIDEPLREQVFEAFFTTRTKGTGLGLAITRRIIEAHGGQIQVGRTKCGAEFLITVPRSLPHL